MEKNVETEIKLLVAADDLEKLVASPLVKKVMKRGSRKKLDLLNIYYDTPSLALKEAGIAYRVRRTGARSYEATIKLDKNLAGGLTQRREYNVPCGKEAPGLAPFEPLVSEIDFAAVLNGEEPEELFRVTVEREIRLLQITPETLVEMAIDRGEIKAAGKTDPIEEVELELKEGNLADLLGYTSRLATLVPVFTESRSKFVRGMVLLGKMDPSAMAPAPFRVDGEKAYTEEYRNLFFHYGTLIMEEQNAFLESDVDREADRIFLPYFRQLEQGLFWIRPMLPYGDEMERMLRQAVTPLKRLRALKALEAKWLRLYGLAGSGIGPDKVDRMIVRELDLAAAAVREQIADGGYTEILFSFWHLMTRAPWKAEEMLQVRELQRCRTSELVCDWLEQEKQAAEARKAAAGGASGEETEIPESAAKVDDSQVRRLVTILSREKKKALKEILGKKGSRRLKKISAALERLDRINCYPSVIPDKMITVKAGDTSRQCGMLFGWCMAAGLLYEEEVERQWKKWRRFAKSLCVR